jgi:hypothetical protein
LDQGIDRYLGMAHQIQDLTTHRDKFLGEFAHGMISDCVEHDLPEDVPEVIAQTAIHVDES